MINELQMCDLKALNFSVVTKCIYIYVIHIFIILGGYVTTADLASEDH